MRKLLRRLRHLLHHRQIAEELAEEIDFHRALKQRELEEKGFGPQEAAYAARQALGNETLAREASRAVWLAPWLQSVAQDTTYALRGLRRDPFLTLTATLTLAVCIGANTAVFSLANSVLIRPLPYPDSERIDWISEIAGPSQEDIAVAPDYFYLRNENRIFEEVAAFVPTTVNWTGVERPEQLNAAIVSSSFFRLLGTSPLYRAILRSRRRGSRGAGCSGCSSGDPAFDSIRKVGIARIGAANVRSERTADAVRVTVVCKLIVSAILFVLADAFDRIELYRHKRGSVHRTTNHSFCQLFTLFGI